MELNPDPAQEEMTDIQRILAGAMVLGLASMLSAASQTSGGSTDPNPPSQAAKKKQGRKHGGKRHTKTSTRNNAAPLNPAN